MQLIKKHDLYHVPVTFLIRLKRNKMNGGLKTNVQIKCLSVALKSTTNSLLRKIST